MSGRHGVLPPAGETGRGGRSAPRGGEARRPSAAEEARPRSTEEERTRRPEGDDWAGLPNRAAMLRAIATGMAELPSGSFCAFVSVGVDEHSDVSDAFGFEAGDRLLQRAAERLARLDLPVAGLAQIDSGVFGLLLLDLGDEQQASRRCRLLVDRVFEALSGTVDLGAGVRVEVSASVGCVLWAVRDGGPEDPVVSEETAAPVYPPGTYLGTDDPREVVTSAEIARKRALRAGDQRRLRYFERRMLDDARERVRLMAELRHGVRRGELELFAQPVVDRARRVIGVEGLIRWRSPERGLVPPDAFIPLAEQTGAILEIDGWVLRQACRHLAAWSRDPRARHLTLSVNLSERQARDPGFAETVRAAVTRHAVPPGRLAFELTESVLHTDVERTRRLLASLREVGVLASLDDFGTGYSSLSYLRQLPVQQLKIDRSFVAPVGADPRSAAIVQSIVQLGRTFGLQVVAEGVETEEQFARLSELGVDGFQGFLFGRPRPIAEFVGVASGG